MQLNSPVPLTDTSVQIGSAGFSGLSPALLSRLGPDATFMRLMGVNYIHVTLPDSGELYITEHGMPFIDHIHPDNWYEPGWFRANRVPLQGTGTVYKVTTQAVPTHRCRSIDIVAKWCRVGQDVPLDTFTLSRAINAEFNTPFEEFSLLEELRAGQEGRRNLRIRTQRPLAIYVPPERMQLWQTGRSRHKILSKIKYHACVEIDILRSYIMIFSWIKGIDAVQAAKYGLYPENTQQQAMQDLTLRIQEELREKGFIVADHKPTHAIVHVRKGKIVRRRTGQIAYALVDYELLAHTPEHQESAKAAARTRYLVLQRGRFNPPADVQMPKNLRRITVAGVDYVNGRAESTGGNLFVAGNDPRLFEYFLPERWRRKLIPLSSSGRTWYTRTKDGVHLVWKVSRVGEVPSGKDTNPRWATLRDHGYNSPFEEFSLAMEINQKGIATSYPRAIYATGQNDMSSATVTDPSRFNRLAGVRSADGQPVLRFGPDYITIWGYWRGLDDLDAPDSETLWSPIGAGQAYSKGLLTDNQVETIVEHHRAALEAAGYEDLNFEPDHVMLSYVPGGAFKRGPDGEIATRHCNFELVRRKAP